ncbi:CDP-glucose 4,6-dehydratase [Lentisphaera araneosa HTCC2155]|uniref:CDP-glucose 4,6-dehydratase n=1 Tax=Lentisphaera araneosa HTCC2155 TaxID=313628 RepID=A6DT22_9BACT|nr:CDP-glucose 4,6-dehydratase [Lentisphaera araneosa]EDM25197.1 CDP-glucose 4,6-dehydratase [Lentisphaera araneosa HTCC2155]
MESMELSFYKDKRVLVTGHTGFKGSWLCQWLEILGAQVFGYSKKLEVKDHFSELALEGDFTTGDICNFDHLNNQIKRIQPEIIFHLAAQPLVRDSYEDPLGTYQTNVMGTGHVLQACRGVDSIKAIICITTDKCYENKEWLWGYRENEPMGGYDPYSASKACAELLISSFRRSFFNLDDYGLKHHTLIASARAGNVIAGGDWSKDRLIPDVIKATMNKEKVFIRSPHSIRPWQHVLDCLYGYLLLGSKLLQRKKECAQAWNFGPADSDIRSVEDILEMSKAVWNEIDYELNESLADLHEAKLLKLDSSQANVKLDWQPLWNCEQSIQRTVAWYKNSIENKTINTVNDINDYMRELSERS